VATFVVRDKKRKEWRKASQGKEGSWFIVAWKGQAYSPDSSRLHWSVWPIGEFCEDAFIHWFLKVRGVKSRSHFILLG
jgi:hypothetical protein